MLRLIARLYEWDAQWNRAGVGAERAALREQNFAQPRTRLHHLDTNAVENAIRPSKLGAKNGLFVGHPDTGDRAAVL